MNLDEHGTKSTTFLFDARLAFCQFVDMVVTRERMLLTFPESKLKTEPTEKFEACKSCYYSWLRDNACDICKADGKPPTTPSRFIFGGGV